MKQKFKTMRTLKFYLGLLICLVFLFNDGHAQKQLVANKPAELAIAPNTIYPFNKCSPMTGMLLAEYRQYQDLELDKLEALLGERFVVHQQNGEIFVGAFIKYNTQLKPENLLDKGIFIKKYPNSIASVNLPLASLESFIQEEGVDFLQVGEPIYQKLDAARQATNVDQVHQGLQLSKQYSGSGVLLGIMDSGFDYTHPNFYNVAGNGYRLKTVWDQSVNGGEGPPNNFSYGTEVEGAQNILNWENDNIPQNGQLISQGTHGTHVAGIAAGSGHGTDGLYTGIAYDSDLAVVSYAGSDQSFADGVAYIFEKADQFNQPCVINMSLGKHTGPHDGTSFFDQICDGLVGPGKILVGAAGNEGEDRLHIRNQFGQDESVIYSFVEFKSSNGAQNGEGILDIWGSPGGQFRVAINFYDIVNEEFISWTEYVNSTDNGNFEFTIIDDDGDQADVEIAVSPNNPLNNKPNIQIGISNLDQTDPSVWIMLEIIGSNSIIDVWSDHMFFSNGTFNPPVVSGDSDFTNGEIGGTGNNVITVGAYTSKNIYQNFGGQTISIPFQVELGELAPFSSRGPTADGRTKPEITAPGNVVASSLSSFDPDINAGSANVTYRLTQDNQQWFFGALQGTSMASPMVAGIVGLMLEANPNLSPNEVTNIITETAIIDQFTGNDINNLWGWGKIDAWEAMKAIADVSAARNLEDFSSEINIAPNPASEQIQLNFFGRNAKTIRILDLNGKEIYRHYAKNGVADVWQLSVEGFQKGMYIVEVSNDSEIGVGKLVVL